MASSDCAGLGFSFAKCRDGLLLLALALSVLTISQVALAHPEDELCNADTGGMDPALCALLAQMDSADGALVQSDNDMMLSVQQSQRGFFENMALYVWVGFNHILPGGSDHILFVLAIFLASRRISSLIWLISVFTVAHTITLGLAATGGIKLPANLVEPMIAFSIAFVAAENLLFNNSAVKWRPILVFLFGLLHGLGFADFFGQLGLPQGLFYSSLIGFNIGVELGQLSVVVIAAMVALGIRRWLSDLGDTGSYQRWVVIPGSALIGLIGLYWGFDRLLDFG